MRFLYCLIGMAVTASAASWNADNSPRLFSTMYQYKLSDLPVNGSTPQPAWSETYWPSYQSGIAHRWNADDPQDFKYHLYTKAELLKLQKAKNSTVMRMLSPAEKFDILNGRYDYPLVHEEWQRTHPNDASWEGICHGWSPASLTFQQPKSCALKNADGIEVYFGSSDIKGLLSYYVGQFESGQTKFAGERCNSDLDADPAAADNEECSDLDAGAFHVIIANQLGKLKQGFVVDIDRGIQVWNQPVNSFESQIGQPEPPRVNATTGTNQSVIVSTDMTYSKETWPQWEAHPAYQMTASYQYYLDLDANGNIIGGEQITWDRVDFVWSQTNVPFFGYFAKLKDVYVKSTNDTSHPFVVEALTVSPDHLITPTHTEIRLGSGSVSLDGYANNARRSWTIGNIENCEANYNNFKTMIRFIRFDTERHHDQLSIYEGPQGLGAIVAVVHGSAAGQTIEVQGPCALLVFRADQANNDFSGFEAEFKVVATN